MLSISNKSLWYSTHLFSIVLVLLLPFSIRAQNNGNPLLFQGLTNPNSVSVKGSAYGNAFVSRSHDLNSLFYNAAGLADINSPQISVASKFRQWLERDNQNFYPGNEYLHTSIYLERLIIPDPSWNGKWSDSLATVWYDSLGDPVNTHWDVNRIQNPVQGEDDYSHQAADHEQTSKNIGFDQLSIAFPFRLAGKEAVAAASYYRQYAIHDYDWNGTHLDPHWGTSTIIQGTIGDTIRTDWSVFTRERSGGLYSLSGALALKLSENLQLGFRINRFSGKSDDKQVLDRVGYFLTKHQLSEWAFAYDTSTTVIEGNSQFSGFNLNLGALYVSKHFNIGANIQLPYKIRRKWTYSTKIQNPNQVISYDSSGVDRVQMPSTATLGITVKPGGNLTLSFDVENTRYDRAEYDLDESFQDSLTIYTKWVNQYTLRFGIEYQAADCLTLIGGYQSQSAAFIPYGVAIRDRGAPRESYSCGMSLGIWHGRLDLAYTFNRLKYYDAYFTNRNFTLEQYQTFSCGYTINL